MSVLLLSLYLCISVCLILDVEAFVRIAPQPLAPTRMHGAVDDIISDKIKILKKLKGFAPLLGFYITMLAPM
jgi:hypothetical protein